MQIESCWAGLRVTAYLPLGKTCKVALMVVGHPSLYVMGVLPTHLTKRSRFDKVLKMQGGVALFPNTAKVQHLFEYQF